MQYIDAHPELAEQGFAIRNAVDVSCSQKKVCLRRARTPSACAVAPGRADDRGRAHRAPQLPPAVQGQRQDVARHRGRRRPRRRRGRLPGPAQRHQPQRRRWRQVELRPPRHAGRRPGIPTVVFPAGYNDHGQPINLQLLGRAWDDDKLVGMAYAFEQLATKDGKGHVAPSTAPALKVVDRDRRDRRRLGAGDAVADARRAGVLRRVHAGRGEGLHRLDDRDRDLDRGRRGADASSVPAI